MVSTRVTQRTVSNTMLNGLQANMSRMQRLQEQLSSGKQVSRPSDSPVQAVEAMQFRSSIGRTEQYVRNADDGLALLATADQALTDGLDITQRVRALTLEGLNDTSDTGARKALALEVDNLRKSLLDVANTRYLDQPVFGGTTSAPDAYDRTNGVWAGNTGEVLRTIGPGTKVAVNVAGPVVFGDGSPAAPELLAVLDDIADVLASEPFDRAALEGGLVDLDKGIANVITALSTLGARTNRIETARDAAEAQLLSLTNSLSEAEDIDLPKTIVELQMQEVAYKAALGATARVVQPSLLDFLR